MAHLSDASGYGQVPYFCLVNPFTIAWRVGEVCHLTEFLWFEASSIMTSFRESCDKHHSFQLTLRLSVIGSSQEKFIWQRSGRFSVTSSEMVQCIRKDRIWRLTVTTFLVWWMGDPWYPIWLWVPIRRQSTNGDIRHCGSSFFFQDWLRHWVWYELIA